MITNKNAFFDDVYQVVDLIPEGRFTTYGAIAQYLGAKGSARMVGWAMNKVDPHLAAHRVLNRNGLLTGKTHFVPPGRMQQLLESEGILVVNNQVVNFEQHFWDPSKELA